MKLKIYLFFLLPFFMVPLFGQDVKISKDEVPPTIAKFISNNYPTAKRVKYFKEIINDSLFMEIKLTFRNEKYALRFHEEKLYEEEIELSFAEIPTHTREAIKATLNKYFSHHKILKSQEVNPKTHLLYEINIKGTEGSSTAFWELFFDTDGKMLKKTEVIVEPIPSYF